MYVKICEAYFIFKIFYTSHLVILCINFIYPHSFFELIMKERVTLTLDTNVLNKVDKRIDGFKVKNRSHAVELLLLRALGENTPKIGLILAGGKGTRLRPITEEIPKPLIPVHGKPVIQHTIELFKRHGIKKVLLSVGYMADKIKNYFGDGSQLGIEIVYVEESKPQGTAGPLRLAKRYLTDSFVMCNADELKDIDLEEMFIMHKGNNALATIALTTIEDTSAYGVAKLHGSRILEFIEKPKKGDAPSNLINSGLYILEPAILAYIPEGKEPVSVEREVFPKVAADNKLFGFPFSGQWFDTGTMERYEKALKHWKGLSK